MGGPASGTGRLGMLLVGAAIALSAGCGSGREPEPLTTRMPLHLEEHLDAALLEGSQIPAELMQPLDWPFDRDQPDWSGAPGDHPLAVAGSTAPVAPRLERHHDALRVHLGDADGTGEGDVFGFLRVALPDLTRADWADVLVRARTEGPVTQMGITFNASEESDVEFLDTGGWRYWGDETVVVSDGQVHVYSLRADWTGPWFGDWQDPWTDLGLWFGASEPTSIDILSVTIVPKVHVYATEPAGVRSVNRGEQHRRSLFVHTPATLTYRVRAPRDARLDVGLGVLSDSDPVTFEVFAGEGDARRSLLRQTVSDASGWTNATADLRDFGGTEIPLTIRASSTWNGSVAFLAAPTITGDRSSTDQPNVILYVIDGAGADLMSVYGYERPTTPRIEALASRGALFEHAHTNSAWTKPSTASFMTSLHHSVLGGFASNTDQVPTQARTMAELFHEAGYQTAVFTANPFAASLSGLQRGVDVMRDKGAHPNSASSVELHEEFWRWRDAYPGGPYWVHFQTTDVHEPHDPPPPFAGTYVSPEERQRFDGWWAHVHQDEGPEMATVLGHYRDRLQRMGVDPREFFEIQRGLYDETMTHNDHQLGLLVEELRRRGEWDNTLLVIASDHGHPAGSFSRFGRGLLDPVPDETEGALADSYRTRIPLLFIWEGRIAANTRHLARVSMLDLLPTILELTGLPPSEAAQGRSLASLLLGESDEVPEPLILDQFQTHLESGELVGHLEIVDGKWAASLEIVPAELEAEYQQSGRILTSGGWRAPRPHFAATPRLLLYDLESDPFCTRSVHAEHPDLVARYTEILEARWRAHRALAEDFSRQRETAMTPEQLRTLQALGYVQ